MKRLKFLLTICLISSTLGIYAQDGQGGGGGGFQQLSPEDRAYNQTKQMKKTLSLSKEQFDKIEKHFMFNCISCIVCTYLCCKQYSFLH